MTYCIFSLKNIISVERYSAVKQWLIDSKPSQTDLSYGGVMSKSLWSQSYKLEIKDELLYRKWTDDKGTTLQAFIPLQDRRKVLACCHNHKTVGHILLARHAMKREALCSRM